MSAFNPPWICYMGNLVMLLATLRWNHPRWKTRERKKVEEEEEEGGGRRRTTHRLSQGSLGQCQLWWQRPLVRHHHRKLKQGKKHRYHTWTAVKLMIIQCSRLNMQMKGWSKQLQWHSLNLWHDNEVFILKTHHTLCDVSSLRDLSIPKNRYSCSYFLLVGTTCDSNHHLLANSVCLIS